MGPLYYLRFADCAGDLAGVRLVIPIRPNQILRELKSRGYSVVEHGILPA